MEREMTEPLTPEQILHVRAHTDCLNTAEARLLINSHELLRARLDAAEQKYIELRGMLKVIAMDKDRSERTEIIYEVLNRHDNTNSQIQRARRTGGTETD